MTPSIGRLLQILGMIILPIGLSFGLFGDNVRLEVRMLAIGGALFITGWLMAKKTA